MTQITSKDLLMTRDWKRGSLLFRLRAFHRPRRSHWLEGSVVSEVFGVRGIEVLIEGL